MWECEDEDKGEGSMVDRGLSASSPGVCRSSGPMFEYEEAMEAPGREEEDRLARGCCLRSGA